MPKKPECLQLTTIAQTRLFRVEQMDLCFANGERRSFERVRSGGRDSVLIVPLLDNNTVLLAREYAAGTDRYELGFPKGVCEAGEEPLQTANRELMEEIGYGAHDLRLLKQVTVAPGYFSTSSQLILATDLYEKRLPGDEPEEIEVVPWQLSKLDELLARDDFTEARSIAALYMVKYLLEKEETQ